VTGADEVRSSQPESTLLDEPPALPLTSRSKSSSVVPLVSRVDAVMAPKDMKSSVGSADAPLELPDNSCSFLVCSSSTLLDKFLMRSMKD
jgi:hypothetical protein